MNYREHSGEVRSLVYSKMYHVSVVIPQGTLARRRETVTVQRAVFDRGDAGISKYRLDMT